VAALGVILLWVVQEDVPIYPARRRIHPNCPGIAVIVLECLVASDVLIFRIRRHTSIWDTREILGDELSEGSGRSLILGLETANR
jgi:hypothetical protein